MTTNARIRTIAAGITGEMIAEQTHLFYDAATGTGSVSFQSRENLYINGAHQPLSGDFNILQADLATIATRQFVAAGVTDPVTGADLSKVSAAGLVAYLKAVFDVLYNERAASNAGA
jgi:hypothetical protein